MIEAENPTWIYGMERHGNEAKIGKLEAKKGGGGGGGGRAITLSKTGDACADIPKRMQGK